MWLNIHGHSSYYLGHLEPRTRGVCALSNRNRHPLVVLAASSLHSKERADQKRGLKFGEPPALQRTTGLRGHQSHSNKTAANGDPPGAEGAKRVRSCPCSCCCLAPRRLAGGSTGAEKPNTMNMAGGTSRPPCVAAELRLLATALPEQNKNELGLLPLLFLPQRVAALAMWDHENGT
jgi:hypothetical protein